MASSTPREALPLDLVDGIPVVPDEKYISMMRIVATANKTPVAPL